MENSSELRRDLVVQISVQYGSDHMEEPGLDVCGIEGSLDWWLDCVVFLFIGGGEFGQGPIQHRLQECGTIHGVEVLLGGCKNIH